ncbi:MAG: lysophospholipid acyltransferase family protein [Eubacteriales bacterium]|nr:lysophospholipid acyltransferase family protein [Eubacteriales bacterium]MDD4474670.1 lysophospholipid acyltransferase family protein [Eubacteriales bacterium]
MKLYSTLVWIAKYLVLWIFPVKLVGNGVLPKGSLVCSNHISNWDPIFIAATIKSKLHFMAKAELFKHKPLASFFRKINIFPVRRGGHDVQAMRDSINILKEGHNLLMFPEGTRVMDKKPDPANAKAGVGLIAANTGVDIIPVAVYNKWYRVKLFRPVYVVVGKPIPHSEYMSYSDGDRRKIAEFVFIKINEELDRFESEKAARAGKRR